MKILLKIIFELAMLMGQIRAMIKSIVRLFKRRNKKKDSSLELKLTHFMSPNHPMHKSVMVSLSEDINEATQGNLKIKIFPSGELGKGAVPQYKRVLSGMTDLAFGITAYTPDLFPRTTLVHLPGLFKDTKDATNAIWNNMDCLEEEFKDVKLLGLWTNNPAVFLSRIKPIRSMADMKGLRVRAPNPAMSSVVEAWGGIPVAMPLVDMSRAMLEGGLDCIILGPSGIGSRKLNEISKYITVNFPSVVDTFYILMNKQSWNSLDEDQKVLLDELTGRKLSLRGAGAFYKAGQAGLRSAMDCDVEFVEAEESAIAEMRETMGSALHKSIQQVSRQIGSDAETIVAGLRNTAAE